MTSLVLAVSLVLSPHMAPLQVAPAAHAGSETVQPRLVSGHTAARLDPTIWTDTALSLTFDGPPPTTTTLPPPPVLTLRERVLSKFVDLGAPQWVVNAFDCVGWRESGWENKRSRTGDDGTLQINDVHDPELRRLGLDPYVPEDAATFAWLLFTRAGWSFRDWTVRGACGLR